MKSLISVAVDFRNAEQIKCTALEKDNFLFLENKLPKLYASLNSLEIINL